MEDESREVEDWMSMVVVSGEMYFRFTEDMLLIDNDLPCFVSVRTLGDDVYSLLQV